MQLKKSIFISFCFSLLLFAAQQTTAQTLQLKNAVIIVSPSVGDPMQQTVQEVLREEIAKRTRISLPTVKSFPTANPVIAIVNSGDKELAGKKVPQTVQNSVLKAEGFRIFTEQQGKNTIVWIMGADARGVLFGAGWLLRQLHMAEKTLQLKGSLDYASSPDYAIRGHQLGYRTTANSYDAWTVQQFDEYIRELAIFGSNAVEGIPFHEDEVPSPHFKISAADMRIKLGEICAKYDMDYWVWTPVTFDLKDKTKREAELNMHEDFYKATPRLDHIFLPGGDPGDNHPSEVMPFLEELYKRVIKYHPNGKVWLSLQGFNTEQIDYFYDYLKTHQPKWFAGVVSGPSSPPIAETRYRLPAQYQHRQYPDITHSVRCQFPVEQFDQAYALTLGRESVNPRPYSFARILDTYAPFTDGFLSYSDGNHDDVNKVIWSARAWNMKQDVHEILKEYSRFFFGAAFEDAAANGIEGLENNWRGPLAENGGVEAVFDFWKTQEAKASALNQNNWRWQMLLLRAYYDTYIRRRLLNEQESEKKVNSILLQASATNIHPKMQEARLELSKPDNENIAPGLRKRIEDLCAALFRTTGFQTSVPKYKANGYERGAVLDFVDYPLNNRWWIADEFAKIEKLSNTDEKLKQLQLIAQWEEPGAGSYYDDVSSISKGPRVNTTSYDATDIAWWDNGFSRKRLSFQTFQREPALQYENLDPGARYTIKVCGFGDALLRVDGVRLSPLYYNKEADSFKEWIIPLSLTQDGKITVTFDEPEESHLNWRQNSRISDIWLLKH